MHDDAIVPECDRLPFDAEKAMAGESVCTWTGEKVEPLHYEDNGRVICLFTGTKRVGWRCQNELRMIRQPVKEDYNWALDYAMRIAKAHQYLPTMNTIPTRYDPVACEPFDYTRAENGEAVYSDAGLNVSPDYLRMAPRKTKRWWIVSYETLSGSRIAAYTALFQTEAEAVGAAKRQGYTMSFTDIPE